MAWCTLGSLAVACGGTAKEDSRPRYSDPKMIRPRYQINDDNELEISDLLMPAQERPGRGTLLHNEHLKRSFAVSWDHFVGDGAQKARKIDSRIAKGLFDLGFDEGDGAGVLKHLAQRNLLRGYVLSIPTGQAIANAMGIHPLKERELLDGAAPGVEEAFNVGGFGERTPLWYYILREAELHADGKTLGAVGSRIVAETLIGMLKADPNSYLNSAPGRHDADDSIVIGGRIGEVEELADILRMAGQLHPHRGHHRGGRGRGRPERGHRNRRGR